MTQLFARKISAIGVVGALASPACVPDALTVNVVGNELIAVELRPPSVTP
jgi:hypothetical protein